MSNARNLANLLGTGTQITTADIADGAFQANKNLIINGDMQVWQRGTAATVATNSYATVDRYKFTENTSGVFTSERSTDSPTGTGYSVKVQCTTADTSMAAGDYAYMVQNIEAQNLQSLQYGTSSAKTLTLSFWVKSNLTGTYTIALGKVDNTVYIFVHEYTISQANTWEKKTITISPTAGSTSFITSSAGAIDNDNGTGLALYWWLCSGTDLNGATSNAWSSNTNHYTTTNIVNWFNSTSNNFYLAQAQLEIGDTATPFEHEQIDTTQRKCRRYYEVVNRFIYPNKYSTVVLGDFSWEVEKRAQPTLALGLNGTNTGSHGLYVSYTAGGYIYKGSENYDAVLYLAGNAEL